MAALYLVSTRALAGKTALGAALGLWMRDLGQRVGYLKPISMAEQDGGTSVDGDALLMRRAFKLSELPQELVGVTLTPAVMEAVLKGQTADFRVAVSQAFERTTKGRDAVILEGPHELEDGAAVGLPPVEVARLLHARVLLVVRYNNDLAVDEILTSSTLFGPLLVGVVINAVTPSRLDYTKETLVPFLESKGIRVLGLIPQERSLMGVSVGDLADGLKGEIILHPDKRDDLVHNVMIGTMAIESAYDYFRRKSDKAVIVTCARPDLMIAALQTSTKCLIVTGHLPPNPVVLARAEEMGVPIITVRRTTLATVEAVEEIFGKVRFHQEGKLPIVRSLLGEHVNLEALSSELLSLAG